MDDSVLDGGSDRLVTTFRRASDFGAAVQSLEHLGAPYEILVPPAGLSWVAAPALVMTSAVRGRLEAARGEALRASGWVEYRAPSTEAPRAVVSTEVEEDVFGRGAITVLSPCVADDTKIRIVAEISGDLAPVLPYLNALLPNASYVPAGDTLTFLDGHRMVALRHQRIAIAKADEIEDAWLRLHWIREMANDAWARRAEIQPSYETRKKPPALEILKRLPGTNCGRCGEMTCMAFALRLWAGEVRLAACPEVFEPERRAHLEALREICAALGIESAGPPSEPRAEGASRCRPGGASA